MIYLGLFAISTFLFYLASKCRGALAFILAVSALVLPCLVAGFRDETIGNDVLSYAKWMFESATVLDLSDFLQHEADIAGAGWNVFTWIVIRLVPTMPFYLFAIEALCIAPIYLGLRRMTPGCEWAGMLIWFLTQYAFSLNGMRQSVAMGLCFYALAYVLDDRPLPFLLTVACAILFHQTALVALFIYPFCMLLRSRGGFVALFEEWSGVVLVMVVTLILGIGFISAPRIVVLASAFKESYIYQVEHLGANNISLEGFYFFIAFLGLDLVSHKDFEGDANLYLFYALTSIVTIGNICWQLDIVSDTLGRIGYYGFIYMPLFCAYLVKQKGYLHYALAVLVLLPSFVVPILYLGHNNVYPYVSSILHIG